MYIISHYKHKPQCSQLCFYVIEQYKVEYNNEEEIKLYFFDQKTQKYAVKLF